MMIITSWRVMACIMLSLLVFGVGLAWPAIATAAPAITSLTGTPTLFPPKVKTNVVFTITVTDPTLNTNSAQLERQQDDGSWKVFSPIGLKPTSTPIQYSGQLKFNESAGGRIRVRLRATFRGADNNKYFSPVLELSVGTVVQPSNQDVTIPGPAGSGVSITVKANSLHGSASVGISPAPASAITAPSPLTRVATVDIVFQSASPEGPNLTAPLLISVPAPAGTPPTAHFHFVQEVLADSPTGGLTSQLLIVDSGIVSGSQIVSDTANPILPGVFGGGVVGVLRVPGSGYVIGRVVDSTSTGLYGVRMVDTQTSVIWTSDTNGNFIVPVGGSDYKIQAIDGFRCVKRDAPTTAVLLTDTSDGSIQNINNETYKTLTNPLQVITDNTASPTRPGIRNSGFELGVPTTCWRSLTAGQLVQRGSSPYRDAFNFNPAITIEPSEGKWMAALTNTQTTFEQEFLLPSLIDGTPDSDFKKLRFDYIFACTGTCPTPSSNAIALQAVIVPSSPSVSVSPTFKQFNGQLGWRTAELDVRNITAGTQVTLRFTVTNATSNTVVLIDNIRFDTVSITADIVTNPPPHVALPQPGEPDIPNPTTAPLVEDYVGHANEILSQAGIKLRLKLPVNPTSPANSSCNSGGIDFFVPLFDPTSGTPNDPAGMDIEATGSQAPWGRSAALKALTCLGPTAQPTDPVSNLHVYFVNLLVHSSGPKFGVAVSPEEYSGNPAGTVLTYDASNPFDAFNASAIVLSALTTNAPIYHYSPDDKNRERETLAHEMGHVLLHTITAASSLEHNSALLNLMNDAACSPRYNTTQCASRPFFTNAQAAQVDPPNPPLGPRCPVTCQH
ncbi:MAG: ImmA/IrrE family metallo-endopeptidase [Nitrospiraceae bacterium]